MSIGDKESSNRERLIMFAGSVVVFLQTTQYVPGLLLVSLITTPMLLATAYFREVLQGADIKLLVLAAGIVLIAAIWIGFWFFVPNWRYGVGVNILTFLLISVGYVGYLRGSSKR